MLRRPLLGLRNRALAPVEVECIADEYEWRQFADSAHLYLSARLADEHASTVVAWCERVRPWPLGHERGEIGRMRLNARHLVVVGRCPMCGRLQRQAHMDARQRGREVSP